MKVTIPAILILAVFASAADSVADTPARGEVLEAMERATDFMAGEVSLNGGYLFSYAADLSDQWGEAPARPSQIWVQQATPDMGELFLHVYGATGDERYLRCAERAAEALVYGQHRLGGWHYFIDFDKPGLADWYERVFSRFKWGMEEYRHYYGNCTYDDNTTQGATRFLLRLYMTTLDPAWRAPLLKALDFMLISQYPNGSWPQRYPLRHEFVHDGLADYTSYYTMNDNSMRDILSVLIEAWEKLGDERYLDAALRGADFMLAAQGPLEQAGWAEQYDMNMQPAWARTHEPAGYMPRQSEQCMYQLMEFYRMTGDRRYLDPIPRCIDWLERTAIETLPNGRIRVPRYLEAGANRPIYQHKTDTVNEKGYGLYIYNDDPTGVSGGWVFTEINLPRVRREYEEVSSLSPAEAVAQYRAPRNTDRGHAKPDGERVGDIIASLDDRGAWVGDVTVYDVTKTMTDEPRKTIRGISTATFMRNMRVLADYVRE